MWSPCSPLATHNQGPKELFVQQLEGVERVGDGEMARLGQPACPNRFRNKIIQPRLADLQPKELLQMHRAS